MAGKGDLARRERFAQLLAGDPITDKAAGEAAGFTPGSRWPDKLKKKPEFIERVAEIRKDASLVGPDLAPVILRLFGGAEAAMTAGSGGAFSAAARMLAEAARLKRVDGVSSAAAAAPPVVGEASLAEWADRWAPPD